MKPQWEVELLRCIKEVQEQVIEDVDPKVVFDNLLHHLLELTESEYGFIGQILYDDAKAPHLKTHAITNIAWDAETRAFYETRAPDGMEFHNMNTLFGAAITSEQPVISNAPATDARSGGRPAGHPPLNSFLGVPFHRHGKLIGMVGVANRVGGYEERLVSDLGPFLAVCASTIEAFMNQRERARAEAALRESEQRYRRLVEDQPELLCRLTPDLSLTFVNRAYADYFGKTVQECRGLNFLELVPQSTHDAVRDSFLELGKNRHINRSENQVIEANGEVRWIQWTHRALFDERGGIAEFQSLGLDVTDRKQAEEHRLNLETQIRQVQKLESLGVLAGGIAHDFNNLLTGILGNASLARQHLPSESPAARYIDRIDTTSRRAADLCAQMLAYSGRGRFVPKPVGLSAIVEEMVGMLELAISKKAVFELDVPADLPAIDADETQIRQVVMNLITNASEALGGGVGTIRAATGVRECSRADLQATFLDDELPGGTYVFVEVADSGSGMREATVAKVFDPFFSTKFPGRGLGLAAVLGIVRGHRGAVQVASRPGCGTTFTILFPASAQPVATVEGKRRSTEVGDHSGLILVMDDEEAIREVVRNSLEHWGFDVLLAKDGSEGLQIFRERMDEIRLVLVDLTMPRLGGEEVMTEMRRLRDDVRVILSSGYDEQDVMDRVAGLERVDFLQKPYRPGELLSSIQAALAEPGPGTV